MSSLLITCGNHIDASLMPTIAAFAKNYFFLARKPFSSTAIDANYGFDVVIVTGADLVDRPTQLICIWILFVNRQIQKT